MVAHTPPSQRHRKHPNEFCQHWQGFDVKNDSGSRNEARWNHLLYPCHVVNEATFETAFLCHCTSENQGLHGTYHHFRSSNWQLANNFNRRVHLWASLHQGFWTSRIQSFSEEIRSHTAYQYQLTHSWLDKIYLARCSLLPFYRQWSSHFLAYSNISLVKLRFVCFRLTFVSNYDFVAPLGDWIYTQLSVQSSAYPFCRPSVPSQSAHNLPVISAPIDIDNCHDIFRII